MPDVVPHRTDERLLFGPLEELHLNLGVAPRGSRAQPMHSIDHPHRGTVNNNGRQSLLCFGEDPHMVRVLTLKAG